MRSNPLVLVLFCAVWIVPLAIVAVDGPSARPLVFLLLALSAWLYASSRPWPGRHHRH